MEEFDSLNRAALGSNASVGDLYNARKDCFTGMSIFKKEVPKSSLKIIDNHFSDIQFLKDDNFDEKFTKLDVSAELKLSVLGGLFTLEGSGKYLSDNKSSSRTVKISLLYNIKSVIEELNIFHEDMADAINIGTIEDAHATHVVAKINWGANCIMTTEYKKTESENYKEIQGSLQASMQKLAFKISGKGAVDYKDGDSFNRENINLKIFGDILPENGDFPQTHEDALKIMRQVPKLIEKSNLGKGRPLLYVLIPISVVRKHLSLSIVANNFIYKLAEESIMKYVELFDEILKIKMKINDITTDLEDYAFCIPQDAKSKYAAFKSKLAIAESKLRSKLATILVEVRSQKVGAEALEDLCTEFLTSEEFPVCYTTAIDEYNELREKIFLVQELEKKKVIYIGREDSLDNLMIKYSKIDLFVLFYNDDWKNNNLEVWKEIRSIFLSEINDHLDDSKNNPERLEEVKYIFVDVTINTKLSSEANIYISHYRETKCISHDIVPDLLKSANICLAKSSEKVTQKARPNKRCHLKIYCPGVKGDRGKCREIDDVWHCYKCKDVLEYGFDDSFYCLCGARKSNSYVFKCNTDSHGSHFSKFEEDELQAILDKMRPFKELNILILGETGVGKSTWINGFLNYITYNNLEEAIKGDPIFYIPSSFTMTDDNYEERIIKMGEDINENHKAGESCTQQPRAYVVPYGDSILRLIDTPGIGDTRGIDVDKKNFQGIMTYLSHVEELHGICILLKPNNARLTVMFQFCIKELLTHLHKDASKNISFVFTNARSTFYRPGDTLPALKSLLLDKRYQAIALAKDTIYCMDNESVRFLAAVKNEISFDDSEQRNYSESWNKSVQESLRLIKHIESLDPHSTKSTLTLNEAKKMILEFTEPIAQISKNITTNLAVIEDKKEEIKNSKKRGDDLLKDLKIPVQDFDLKTIDFPRTVCTSSGCIEIFEGKRVKYKTWCHEHCYLDDIQVGIFPQPGLKGCGAMNSNGYCNHCGCRWDKHTHINYEYVDVQRVIENEDVKDLIKKNSNDIAAKNAFIYDLDKRKKNLENEKNQIIFVSTKFGSFLKHNAIVPYNDALRSYLQHLISAEEEKIACGGDRKILEDLKKFLANYNEEVDILERAMEEKEELKDLTPEDINKLVSSLYNLPINGQKFKEIVLKIKNTTIAGIKYNEKHYIPPKKPGGFFSSAYNKFKNIF